MLNRLEIIGRLGKVPESRTTPAGNQCCMFSVATSETWKDKAGEKHEETCWHNVVVWNKLAEICQKYLTKGSLVYLSGPCKNRSWEDKDGNKKYITELIANEMKMLDTKGSGERPLPAEPAPAKEPEWLKGEAEEPKAAEDDTESLPF